MFWGLILEPQRRYSQIVKRSFHISKASLDIFASTDKPCQVMLTSQNRNYLLCTLQKDTKLQCNLDLNFIEGEEVMFATNGGSNVHLTGYLMEDDMASDEEDCVTTEEEVFEETSAGSKRKRQLVDNQPKKKTKTELLLDEIDNEYNSEDDPTYPNIEDNDVESEEIEDDADEDEEDDSDESVDDISNLSKEDVFTNGGTGKRQLRKATQALLNKSNKDSEESDDEEEDDEDEEEEKPVKQKLQGKMNGISKTKKEKPSKGDKSAKQQKVDKESPKPEKSSNVSKGQESKSPKKTRQIEGGVTIQDLKEGEGKVVKSGRVVQVYYEGRLKSNNKLFDSASKGAGFKFRVGKKEVIKGWDLGLIGMKVGGKRRIVCPPNMAYGAQGSGSVIPPNSTLIFDIEVKNVN